MSDRRAAAALRIGACIAILLAGCSGAPPPPVPAAVERAGAMNRRGLAAEARGNYEGALAAFTESLKASRSIEDDAAAAAALVNIARLLRLRGDVAAAAARIDEALALAPAGNPLFADAAYEKAKACLAAGDLPAAETWAARAADAEKGDQAGRRTNLLARILLLEGKTDDAAARANAALSLSRKAGLREEEANSLRLLGDAAAARRDGPKAAELYAAALAADKDIAKSRKIAADLRALGALAAGGGETGKALGYYRRAVEVSRNGDDPTEAAAALLEMSKLHEKSGDPEKAKRALAEREELLGTVKSR